MSDQPEPLAAILAEMRGNEFDDPHLDADGIIGARRLARDFADRIEAAAKREAESLRAKMESEKRWACEYFTLARRREDALAHCKQYAQKIERENEEGETRLDSEEIIATVDNELAGIRPARAPGNAAAMRTALERLLRFLQWMYAQEGRSADVGRNRLSDEIDVAVSALATPARNCDRFKTEGDAHREYLRIFDHPDPVHYAKWLFAPAEGGAE